MKKIKCFFVGLFCFLCQLIFSGEPVQPFIVLTNRPLSPSDRNFKDWVGGEYSLELSPGFPLEESKLLFTLRQNRNTMKLTLDLSRPVPILWQEEYGKMISIKIPDAIPRLKYDFPWQKDHVPWIHALPRLILQPNRKQIIQTLKWQPDGFRRQLWQQVPFLLENGDVTLELELQIPEKVLEKYASAMTRNELLLRNFLKKIGVPEYLDYAETVPLNTQIELLDQTQFEYDRGQKSLNELLKMEFDTIMLFCNTKNLPVSIQRKLSIAACRRLKKTVEYTKLEFSAGTASVEQLEKIQAELKNFMLKHNIRSI